MNDLYAGVILTDSTQKRGRAVWVIVGLLVAVLAVGSVVQSVVALANGDTDSTIDARGWDVPVWSAGFFGIGLAAIMWWAWRRQARSLGRREALINFQPMEGGIYVIGNEGSYRGVSLPVADNSAMRISLVKTGSASYGLIKFYGLEMTSAHGRVLMDVHLMPKALDLSPLLAELARRRVKVDLDPALATLQPLVATQASPPVPQMYQSAPTHQSTPAYQPAPQPQAPQPPPTGGGWDPQ
jgi:hypothetical protein